MTFQRNVDFSTHQVRNLGNTANVPASIDPFFFKIDPPTIFDICKLIPWLCFPFRFEPGKRSVAQELHREVELPGL